MAAPKRQEPVYPGVWVNEKDIHSNSRKVAAYLSLDDTNALREFESSDKFTAIANPFNAVYEKSFNINDINAQKSIAAKSILAGWDDAPSWAELKASSTFDHLCDKSIRSDRTPRLCWMKAVNEIITAHPDTFKDGNNPREDVHRGIVVLKHYLKAQGPSRQKSSGRVQNSKAVTLKWFARDGEAPLSTMDEKDGQAPDINSGSMKPMGPVLPEDDESDENEDMSAEAGAAVEKTTKDPMDDVWTVIDLNGPDCLPQISRNAQSGLLKIFAGDIDISFRHGISGVAISRSDLQRDMEALGTEQDAAITEDASDKDRDAKIAIVREDFLKLNREMNTVSAPESSYKDACSHLNLDPKRPMVSGVELRPFQVTGVDWLVRMEREQGRSGILNDECGLGKTIQ